MSYPTVGDRSQQKLKGGALVGAPRTSAGRTYKITKLPATSFVQSINLASLATTFILTLRMAIYIEHLAEMSDAYFFSTEVEKKRFTHLLTNSYTCNEQNLEIIDVRALYSIQPSLGCINWFVAQYICTLR